MAFHLYEDTWETSTTTGAGDYALAGAAANRRPFSAQYADGDTTWAAVSDGGNFEAGIYTYHAGANSLSRTAIYRSTNANAAVDWGAGTRNIAVAALGIVLEQLLAPGSAGIPHRTADNAWSYYDFTPLNAAGDTLTSNLVMQGENHKYIELCSAIYGINISGVDVALAKDAAYTFNASAEAALVVVRDQSGGMNGVVSLSTNISTVIVNSDGTLSLSDTGSGSNKIVLLTSGVVNRMPQVRNIGLIILSAQGGIV
jgi:hypothetical protein